MADKSVVNADVGELRARLTHYPDLARRGAVVLIIEQGTVLAEPTSPRE